MAIPHQTYMVLIQDEFDYMQSLWWTCDLIQKGAGLFYYMPGSSETSICQVQNIANYNYTIL